jgi:hypothetical protein
MLGATIKILEFISLIEHFVWGIADVCCGHRTALSKEGPVHCRTLSSHIEYTYGIVWGPGGWTGQGESTTKAESCEGNCPLYDTIPA